MNALNYTMTLSSAASSSEFFDTYFSACRFGIECFLAASAVILNVVALTLFCRTRQFTTGKSVYRIQYANLTVINIVVCLFSWMFNNVLYLFHELILYQIIFAQSGICKVMLLMVAGSFVSSAFGVMSTLSMLGFATTQYFAVCRPLENLDLVRKKRVIVFVLCAWIFSLSSGLMPFGISYGFINKENCTQFLTEHITRIALVGCNISITLMTVMYVLTIYLCIKIYLEVRSLHRRLTQFRFVQNVQGEKKVFVTTVILLLTLSVFFLPFTVVYIVSLNMTNISILQDSAVIYYMNFLPYFKFISDPLVYGARMQDMQFGVRQMLSKTCLRTCVSPPQSPTPSSGRSSMRIPLRSMRSYSLTTI